MTPRCTRRQTAPGGFRPAAAGRSCDDRPMRAFICEVDHHGLRRLVPEDLVPGDDLTRYASAPSPRPTTVARALLADGDAEDVRAEILAGRHDAACGLLLNRAIELVGLGAAVNAAPPRTH